MGFKSPDSKGKVIYRVINVPKGGGTIRKREESDPKADLARTVRISTGLQTAWVVVADIPQE